MKKMTIKEFIDSKAADLWDECNGNWIVWDHYNPDNEIIFFKVYHQEPAWNEKDYKWEANEAGEYFTANLSGIELTDILRPMQELKFPLNKSFGQVFSA